MDERVQHLVLTRMTATGDELESVPTPVEGNKEEERKSKKKGILA